MKPYAVELSVTAVVMATSEMDAYSAAIDSRRDIWSDVDPDVDVIGEIKALDRLPEGWDPDCLPYGGDGATRLKDFLPETEPDRDTRTIDMFQESVAVK